MQSKWKNMQGVATLAAPNQLRSEVTDTYKEQGIVITEKSRTFLFYPGTVKFATRETLLSGFHCTIYCATRLYENRLGWPFYVTGCVESAVTKVRLC